MTKYRIFFAIGPGDVVKSYRYWRAGEQFLGETSQTYSSQFFEYCRLHGHAGFAVSSCSASDRLQDGEMTVENRPKRFQRKGLHYHLSEACYAFSLMISALRWRADVVIVDSGTTHWALLSVLKLFGVRVIGCLHNVLWPNGYWPSGTIRQIVLWSEGLFWRYIADGLLAVSPECERQVRQLTGGFNAPAVQYRVQYREADFSMIAPVQDSSRRPFRVMFAGRVERDKGVFDLVTIARILEERQPGQVLLHVCGTGPALEELGRAVRDAGLSDVIELRGRLDRPAMLRAYSESHLVIVPTRSDFCEGMPMVCAEAVLAGRPVLTSRLSNALDVLPGAVIEAQPDDPRSYADRIDDLLHDPRLYSQACAACAQHRRGFLDPRSGLLGALETVMAGLKLPRVVSPAGSSAREPAEPR